MPNHGQDMVTVCPPRLDRTAFGQLDQALIAPHAPYARDWLLARFQEGLQIRLLRPPMQGLVVFQPGKLAWRPILGVDTAIVVQDLRVADGPGRREAAARLWQAVADFAHYFGYRMVVALIGPGPGVIAPAHAPGRGWLRCALGPQDVQLVARVVQGPVSLPALPQDWAARAARLGPGLVIQTSGESAPLEARARGMVSALAPRGLAIRHVTAANGAAVRATAVAPGAAYAVSCDGRYLGGPELEVDDLLRAALGQVGVGVQSPA
ncbi:MAG: hypothetical protein RLZZ491_2372 [Pseudomonadota bacterium]